MIKNFLLIVLLIPMLSQAQSLMEPRQKAFNNYIQLANYLTSEVQSLGPSLVRYYNEMEQQRKNRAGIELACVADKNYIRGGNNRIILATDGEFLMSQETFELVKKFAGEDIFITVFNFGKTASSAKNLQQLAGLGGGNYEYITRENVDTKLILEAKAKKKK